MSSQGVPPELRGEGVQIPSYAFPENAAHALARTVGYGEWRSRDEGVVPSFGGLRVDEAAAIIADACRDGGRWLEASEISTLFSCYGLPLIQTVFATTPADAGRAAAKLRAPVALKADAEGMIHKSDHGAVRLGLKGARAVEAAATQMLEQIPGVRGFVLQPMAAPGIEMLVGVVGDPLFGPVVACGAGGTTAELLRDVRVRLAPVSATDATEMLRSLSTYPLLEGYRGTARSDIAALEDVVLRIGSMAGNHPEIAEMDCNPVIVHATGASIVDTRVRVELAHGREPFGARRRI